MRRTVARLAARARARVPERWLPALATARSLVGDGPVIGLPPFRRVLVVAPHPDDEVIACGGTIARLAADGAHVTVVVVTDGQATRGADLPEDEIAARRRDECRSACTALGVSDVRFLGHRDGDLRSVETRLTEELRTVLRDGPEVVLLPWFLDAHPDHRAVNRALAAADPADVQVWGGEVWTPVVASRLVEITDVMDRKRAALAAHATAGHAFDLEATLGLDRYRSVHGLSGRGYAEAFLAARGHEYAEAVRRTIGGDSD